ncbi:putative phage replisome organizer [Clostridium beijerinckii]|uniref:phage replisome organizer N-terminal domain-containing protein n=1 Tax=Clostridium beijerinckii TaxID=1520 RepID=UPI001494706A|nr:phage replisome organizer N-terminal domain-containing protein [Clostridium beijerinckii]NOW85836.1 putative phage replisome organizer [Clostridium beijerinckii]
MKERRYVRFRVDMYEDTKFKIMDRMPERDVIYYIWTRIVILAGRVNLDGNLYMSKNIPYTLKTLAIEFNRDESQVKLALDTFIDLEMVEVVEENVYKVKNFAKHQNIKAKVKDITENKEKMGKKDSKLKSEETKSVENIYDEKHDIEEELGNEIIEKQQQKDNNMCNMENVIDTKNNIEIKNEGISDNKNIISTEKINGVPKDNISVPLIMNKNKKSKKEVRKNTDIQVTDEEDDDEFGFYEGDRKPLGKGESVFSEFSF